MRKIALVAFVIVFMFIIFLQVQEKAFNDGFEVGYWECGMNGIVFGNRIADLQKEYGSMKDTPWNEFTIQEKMYLCAYGSPGNRMNHKDINQLILQYGPKDMQPTSDWTVAPPWVSDYILDNRIEELKEIITDKDITYMARLEEIEYLRKGLKRELQ